MRFAGGTGTDLVMLSDAWPLDPFERFPVSIKIEIVKKTFCKIQNPWLCMQCVRERRRGFEDNRGW